MKEIWINLELYFKSYEFSFFRDFSRFLWINFAIFNVKNELKISKKGLIFAPGHVDATWHSGPRGSATRAHASAYVAHMWHMCIIYIYRKYRVIVHISIPIIGTKLTL